MKNAFWFTCEWRNCVSLFSDLATLYFFLKLKTERRFSLLLYRIKIGDEFVGFVGVCTRQTYKNITATNLLRHA